MTYSPIENLKKMKISFKSLLVCATLVSALCFPTNSKADLFKKFGNAIDKLNKGIDKATEVINGQTNTNNNNGNNGNKRSQYSTSSTGSSQYGPAGGADVVITDVSRWGDGLIIQFAVNNKLDEDINSFMVRHNSGMNNPLDTRVIFNNGSEYYTNSMLSNSSLSVPAGGRRAGYVATRSMPNNAQTVDLMLYGRCNTGPVVTKANPYGEFLYYFKSLPIKGFQKSNLEGAYCTNPNLKVNVNKIERQNNSVVIDFALINPTEQELDYSLFTFEGMSAIDSDGNDYSISYSNASGGNDLTLPAEGKKRIIATIKNVPKSVNEFQQIIIPFGNNDYMNRFKFVFKNMPVD